MKMTTKKKITLTRKEALETLEGVEFAEIYVQHPENIWMVKRILKRLNILIYGKNVD